MGPQNALQRTLNVSKIYVILTWHSNDAIKLLIVNCFFFYLFYFSFFHAEILLGHCISSQIQGFFIVVRILVL